MKTTILTIAALIGLAATPAFARSDTHISFGFFQPAPVYVTPAPVYYNPPVVYYPPVQPVYYAPPCPVYEAHWNRPHHFGHYNNGYAWNNGGWGDNRGGRWH